MSGIITFIKEYEILAIIGLFISGFGVHYGKAAYLTALDIFNKGLQIDKRKIFLQIGLEIAWGFCVPYTKFKMATQEILKEKDYNKQKVIVVRDILNQNKFSVAFPYLEEHVGELWNVLGSKGKEADKCTAEEFIAIMEFIKSAKELSDGIRELESKLSSYLSEMEKKKIPNYANLTLVDFFSESQYVNKEIFDRGNNLIKMVDSNLERLPKELGIQEKREKLCRV